MLASAVDSCCVSPPTSMTEAVRRKVEICFGVLEKSLTDIELKSRRTKHRYDTT